MNTQETPELSGGKRVGLLAKLMGASFSFYMSNAAVISYLAVFLYSLGYSEAEVGVITAVNSALSIISGPLWGMLADRWRSTVRALLLCASVGGLAYGAVPFFAGTEVAGFPIVLILIPFAMFFRTPTTSLVDNIFLRKSDEHKLNYGLMRATGSLSFAIASILLGLIVPKTGPAVTFYISCVLFVPALLLIVSACRGDRQSAGTESMSLRDMRFGELFGNGQLTSYLLLSAVFGSLLYCNGNFLPRLLESIGTDGERIGIVMGAKAFVEVPFIAILPWLRKHFRLEWVIGLTGFMFAGQAILYSFSVAFWQIIVVSLLLDGIGAGLFYATSSTYVFSLAPTNLKTTAAALVGAMSSLSGVLGNLLGGFLSDSIGVKGYYFTIGVLSAAAAAIFVITRRRETRAPAQIRTGG